MLKKLILIIIVAFTLGVCMSINIFAQESEYYMIDGKIYRDGSAEINRIDRVDGISSVKTKAGETYALVAFDKYDREIDIVALSVNFELNADMGGGFSEYSEFCALIPYNDKIVSFILFGSRYEILAEAYLDESVQVEIEHFIVEETNGGYKLDWRVKLNDYNYAHMIEYDVLTVSQNSGDSNVLAYRSKETSLFVPYDWLDPNDTVVFILKSNDSRKTLTAISGEFSTPYGEEKNVEDDEKWDDDYERSYYYNSYNSGGDFPWLYIALGIAAFIIIALVILLIIIVKKRKPT